MKKASSSFSIHECVFYPCLNEVPGGLGLGLGHLVEQGLDLLLLVVVLAKVVVAEDVAGDLLQLLQVHAQVREPGLAVLLHHHAGHLQTRLK